MYRGILVTSQNLHYVNSRMRCSSVGSPVAPIWIPAAAAGGARYPGDPMLDQPPLAESFLAVQAALRGAPVARDPGDIKMVWYMLRDERGSDAEITRREMTVWYARGGASKYFLAVAPGVVSILLAGAVARAGEPVIRRIDPATTPLDPYPPCGVRHVRLDAAADRVMIRVRADEAALVGLGPDVPIEGPHRFVVLDRACPHCGQVPERYRALTDGCLVCLACGASHTPG